MSDQVTSIFGALTIIVLAFTAYFAPVIIARGKRDFSSILVVNIFWFYSRIYG